MTELAVEVRKLRIKRIEIEDRERSLTERAILLGMEQGLTRPEIAYQLNMPWGTVQSIQKRFNLGIKKPYVRRVYTHKLEEHRELIYNKWSQGYAAVEIARELKVHSNTVIRWGLKNGMKFSNDRHKQRKEAYDQPRGADTLADEATTARARLQEHEPQPDTRVDREQDRQGI